MKQFVRDYADIMYKDAVTADMLRRDGNLEIAALNVSQLATLATYIPRPVGDNPFARVIFEKVDKHFTGDVHKDMEQYRRICKGFGLLVG